MSTPEKIWVIPDDNQDGCCPVETDLDDVGEYFDARRAISYTRTDLTPPAADYVKGLEAIVRRTANRDPIFAKGMEKQFIKDAIAALAARPASPDTRVVTDAERDVIAERQRQISAEGWTPEHDDQHGDGELAAAASCYALVGYTDRSRDAFKSPLQNWPWAREWWKPSDRRRDLIKAGALIIAEIERLDRKAGGQDRG